jgi:hypothetical protein
MEKLRLSDLIKYKIDLFVELDYLGVLTNVESKYINQNTCTWLIAQVKLNESISHAQRSIIKCYMEINVKENSVHIIRKDLERVDLFNHKLTSLYKLSQLKSDPFVFGYFYPTQHDSVITYDLHVFRSNRTNLKSVLNGFHMQALKLHERVDYQKSYQFKLVKKVFFFF